MHLLLASVSSATAPSGVCRHAANVARGMLASSSVRKVTMIVGEWQASYFRSAFGLEDKRLEIVPISITNHSVTRNFWYAHGLPTVARTSGADIVQLAFPMPLLQSAYAVPVVVSLHDLYSFDIPENFGRNHAWLNRAALRLCLRNADAIACVSAETRTRVHEIFPRLSLEKTTVVPNSIFLSRELLHTPLPGAIRDCPFLLCVAQHRANKNLPLLARAFRLALDSEAISPETKLVLVGNEGPETQLLRQVIADHRLEEHVLFVNGISDRLLLSLYAKCKAVVAPSLLEGFGLPVAEALSVGSRVVCSDIPAFRAMGMKSSSFFDPKDDSGASLVAALQKVLDTPRSAATSASQINPQQAAAMYLALYSKLLLPKQNNAFQPLPADLSVSGDL